jgi:hypothetical protein
VLIDEIYQLIVHRLGLIIACPDRGCGAVLQMIPHQFPAHRAECFLHRGDLGEDIGAIAILLHHLLQPADLALDPAEALAVPLLDVGIHSAGLAIVVSSPGRGQLHMMFPSLRE